MAYGITPLDPSNPYADLAPKSDVKPGEVNKNMFLQLLVAQMRNQDPLNPTEGTEFVGQLAQFQQLETGLNMGQDIAAIRERIEQIAASQTQS
jgi:flagellar basal-body rod modification protein FlgD